MSEPASSNPVPPTNTPERVSVEYGRPVKKLRLQTKLFILFGLVLLAVISCIIAYPHAARVWNRYQALSYLKKADAAYEAQNFQKASEFYSKAYLESGMEPEVVRGIVRFMQKTGAPPEQTLPFWQHYQQLAPPSVEDKIDITKNYIALNKALDARKMLDGLPTEERKKANVLEVEAGILRIEGRTAEAASLMRQAMLLKSGDPESQIKLAQMDLRSPLTEIQQAAVDTLWVIARGDTETSLKAIETIASETKASKEQFQELLGLINDHPNKETRHRYAVLAQMLIRFPEMRDQIYQEEEAKLFTNDPKEAIFYFLLLQSLGEHEKVLNLLPPDRGLKQREFFPVYAESLAATNQWATLRSQLRSAPSLPVSTTELALLNARISKGLGEADDVIRGHLADAASFATASRDIRSVRRVSAIADSMGYPTAALQALRTGATIPQHRVTFLEAILEIQTDQQDAEGMLNTLNDLVSTDPTLHNHHEEQLYLKLLLGLELEIVPNTLSNPKIAGSFSSETVKLLKALSAFRYQNLEALRNALQDVKPDQFSPGQRAVLSGLLSISGNARRGFEIAEKVPVSLLLEEEKKFLSYAL